VGELDLAISDYSVALELDMRNGGANNGEDGDKDADNNEYGDEHWHWIYQLKVDIEFVFQLRNYSKFKMINEVYIYNTSLKDDKHFIDYYIYCQMKLGSKVVLGISLTLLMGSLPYGFPQYSDASQVKEALEYD
jgi:hypothetical protein